MSLDELMRTVTSRAGVVRVRNALNPLLWLSSVASPLCFATAYAFSPDPVLRYGLVGLGAGPIVAVLVAYLYFMLSQPDRLQSEEFILRQIEFRMLERKGMGPLSSRPDLSKHHAPAARIEEDAS